jgi:CRP/FNR family transcriptional regulator, cyclic AMP receptor protein
MMPEEEQLHVLSRVDILEPFSDEELRELLRRNPDTYLQAGEIFYSPEDVSEKLFILKKGRVRIYKTADGRELTLSEIEPGTVFGEMALTAQRLQEAYAQATEPSVLISISREELERIIEQKPQVGIRLVHMLSERLRSYEARMEDITLKDVPARLANIILLLCEEEGVMAPRREIKIPHHYTHERLGTMIGSNREAVTRAFSKLQDEGAIELRRRLIYVQDIDALRRVANNPSPQDTNLS